MVAQGKNWYNEASFSPVLCPSEEVVHATWYLVGLVAQGSHGNSFPRLWPGREITFVTAKLLEAGTLPTQQHQQQNCSIPTSHWTHIWGQKFSFCKYPQNWSVSPVHNQILGNFYVSPFLPFILLPPSPWNLGCFDIWAVLDTLLFIFQLFHAEHLHCLCLMINPYNLTLDWDIQGFETILQQLPFNVLHTPIQIRELCSNLTARLHQSKLRGWLPSHNSFQKFQKINLNWHLSFSYRFHQSLMSWF